MRNDVISRQCRVNMSEVEGMALALSQIAKSLADLKGTLFQCSLCPFTIKFWKQNNIDWSSFRLLKMTTLYLFTCLW